MCLSTGVEWLPIGYPKGLTDIWHMWFKYKVLWVSMWVTKRVRVRTTRVDPIDTIILTTHVSIPTINHDDIDQRTLEKTIYLTSKPQTGVALWSRFRDARHKVRLSDEKYSNITTRNMRSGWWSDREIPTIRKEWWHDREGMVTSIRGSCRIRRDSERRVHMYEYVERKHEW